MRRIALLPLVLFLFASPALADGLYKGHGRKSADLWKVRLNLSGGIHGAADPYDAGRYHEWGWTTMGGFTLAGLEFRNRNLDSLEFFAGYRGVDTVDSYRVSGFGFQDNVRDRYELDALHAGLTFRHYVLNRHSEAHVGAGLGFVHSESRLVEVVDGAETYRFEGDDSAPELHVLVGWERTFADPLTVGLEIGYRWTWLDDPNDFTGAFLGLRLGLTP